MNFIRRFAGILLGIALLAVSGAAQVATSTLEGMVQDQTGAVVPNATITAVNVGTQVQSTVTASAEGYFVFPALQPGVYTVTAEAAGFRKSVHSSLELNVSVPVREIFKLEVGQLTESVMVEAIAVRVQTSEAQLGRAVNIRDIDVLPQLGRQPIALAYLQPGTQIDGGDATYTRINGQRQGSNNSTLDGIDVNDAVVPRLGLSMTANNTDSIAEFRMVTSGGKAEYGRSAGGQVELITRSGTNDLHGGAFEYLRNTKLHANNFFNNSSGVARPIFIQNIFGGSIGGPIRHDKTFIFGNFQARRTAQTTVRNRTVLTPEAKRGLFRWKPPGSSDIHTFDIVKNDPRGKGIDPMMASVLKMLPDPNNFDTGDGLNTGGYRFNNPSGSLEDQFTIKADHSLWSNHRLFYRHSFQRNSSIDALNNADAPFPGQEQGKQGGHRWGLALGSDWVIRPTIVNEFRYGHQSATADFLRPARPKGVALISNDFTDPILTAFPQGRNSPVNEYTDHLSIVKGSHTFKTGLNLRFTKQWGYNDAGIYPNVTLARANGNIPPGTIGPSGSTISSADRQRFENLYNELVGRMDQVTQTFYSDLQKFQPAGASRVRNFVFHEYGFFVQDDWKVRPNFTVNVGLRWEFSGVPYELDTLQGTLDKAAQVNSVANLSDLTVQRSQKWYNNDWNNFAPRIGFAWDLTNDGKTAIRGGYGIYYDRIIGATTSLVDGNTPGFSQAVPVWPNSAGGSSDVRLSDGIPLPQQPSAPVLTLPLTRSTSIVVFNPNLRTGYVHQYSLTLQRELYRNTVIEAGYVGARGVKLFTDLDPNQPKVYGDFLQSFKEIQAFRTSGTAPSANNTLVRLFGSAANAVSGLGASTFDQGLLVTAANTVDRQNYSKYAAAGVSNFYLRNFPQYNQLIVGGNDGRNYYDSFQFSVRRQAGAFKINANYTFSKSLDNISVDGNGFTTPIDNFNLKLNKGRGDYDRPHSFNSALIYTLPIGKGRWLASNAPRWADTLIGGWDLGFLTIWQIGGLFTVSSGRQTGTYATNTWANYSGDRNIGSVLRQGNGVFRWTPEEIARFSFPGAGEIGNSGRNAFRGARLFNTDISLVKRFKLTERHVVSFRAEAYNLFNNVNFGLPGVNLATSGASFGKVSATIGQPRIMQGALRYDF